MAAAEINSCDRWTHSFNLNLSTASIWTIKQQTAAKKWQWYLKRSVNYLFSIQCKCKRNQWNFFKKLKAGITRVSRALICMRLRAQLGSKLQISGEKSDVAMHEKAAPDQRFRCSCNYGLNHRKQWQCSSIRVFLQKKKYFYLSCHKKTEGKTDCCKISCQIQFF